MTSSEPDYFPKAPPLKTISLGLGLGHRNLGVGSQSCSPYPIPLANEWFRHRPSLFLEKMTGSHGLPPFSTWGIWCWGHPLAASFKTRPAQTGQGQEHPRTGSWSPASPVYRQAVPFWSSFCLTPHLPQSAAEKRKCTIGQCITVSVTKTSDLNPKEIMHTLLYTFHTSVYCSFSGKPLISAFHGGGKAMLEVFSGSQAGFSGGNLGSQRSRRPGPQGPGAGAAP